MDHGIGPGGGALNPLTRRRDAGAGKGAGGDLPGEGDAYAVGGADVAGGGLSGHQRTFGVGGGLDQQDLGGLIVHGQDAILAAVAGEVLVTVEGAGHQRQVFAVDVLEVGMGRRGHVALANPADEAVLNHHVYGGDGVASIAVNQPHVPNQEIHATLLRANERRIRRIHATLA